MSRLRLVLVLAVLLALVTSSLPSAAWADADPPSDVLLLQPAYYPYRPVIPRAEQARLDDLLGRAKRAGLPLKVAIVMSAGDLGAVPQMLGHRAKYAAFLAQELATPRHAQPLLVVMPEGFATVATGARAARKIAALPAPPATPTGLIDATIDAVGQVAAARGIRLDTTGLGAHAPKGYDRSTSPLVFLPIVLVVLGVLVLLIRGRRGDPEDDDVDKRPPPFDWETLHE